MISVGEIRKVLTPYYDLQRKCMQIKSRPALIIAKADADDFVILPISTISRKYNIDPVYDVEVDPSIYPLLNLNKVSYIRTHKQAVVHRSEIGDIIGVLKNTYEKLYLQVLDLRECFSREITNQALK